MSLARRLLALGAIAPLLAVAGRARAQPVSHMIVYDASGSMYRADTGETRFRLAQTIVRRLVDTMKQDRIDVPTGLVVFGRQFDQRLRRCDDVELAVPLPPAQDGPALDRIASEVSGTRPNGQTPLVDAIVAAARQMPATGGVITVVTDLDEDTCNVPPCDLEARLRAAGHPLHSSVRIGFIVATGLQQGRDSQTVEEFRRCVGGELRYVATTANAAAVAQEIASSLMRSRPPPPVLPAQASIGNSEIVVSATFSRPTIWPDWRFEEAGASIGWLDQRQRQARTPLVGDAARITAPSRPSTFNLYSGDAVWGQAIGAKIQDVRSGVVPISVAPGTIVATATTPGRSLAEYQFDWLVAGYGRQFRRSTRQPQLEAVVPPGHYDVSLTVTEPATGGVRSWTRPVDVAVDQQVALAFPIDTVPLGRLRVSVSLRPPELFASAETPPAAIVVSTDQNRPVAKRDGTNLDEQLPPGRYRVTAQFGLQTRVADGLEVAAGEQADVTLSFRPSRLIIRAARSDNAPLREERSLVWKVEEAQPGGRSVDLSGRGARLDVTLPAGDYTIFVSGDADGAGHINSLSVPVDDPVSRTVILAR